MTSLESRIPFVDRVRWSMFKMFLDGDRDFATVCASVDLSVARLSDFFMGKREISLQEVSFWGTAFGCRARFKLEREKNHE